MTTESQFGTRHALIINVWMCPNNQLWAESEVAIILHFKLYYTVLQQRTVQETWMQKIRSGKHATAWGKPYRAIVNRHLALSVKRTGTQRRTKVSPWYMHCTCCGWRKDASQDEAEFEQWKNQAHSLIHWWVMLGWKHQWVSNYKWVSGWVSQHKNRFNQKN